MQKKTTVMLFVLFFLVSCAGPVPPPTATLAPTPDLFKPTEIARLRAITSPTNIQLNGTLNPPENPPLYEMSTLVNDSTNWRSSESAILSKYRALYVSARHDELALHDGSDNTLEELQADLDAYAAQNNVEVIQGADPNHWITSTTVRRYDDGHSRLIWLVNPENKSMEKAPDVSSSNHDFVGELVVPTGFEFKIVWNQLDDNFYVFVVNGGDKPIAWVNATKGVLNAEGNIVDALYYVDKEGRPEKYKKVMFDGQKAQVMTLEGRLEMV